MPSLRSAKWLSLLTEMSDDEPFSYLKLNGFTDLSETALSPSPELLAKEVDPELPSFFKKLFSKPEMTDLVWLNMFRIISSRMGREKHVIPLIIYRPTENELVAEIDGEFRRIAEKYGLKNDYGFITPLACGQGGPICMEQLSHSTHYLNVYEESKAQAERDIAQFCDQQTLPYTIIRPTIVYGDSRTGRSLKFNALYYPLRSLMAIRDIYINDIQNNGGKRSKTHGIYLDEDGYLFLPLKIVLPKSGGLNLIPVNYFVEATLRIIKNAHPGGIYHLSSTAPVKMETVISFSEQFMKMKGVEMAYAISPQNNHRNPAEELFDRFVKAYLPYMHDNRQFDRTNTDAATSHLQPAAFTNPIFKRCMDYAVAVEWGDKLKQYGAIIT